MSNRPCGLYLPWSLLLLNFMWISQVSAQDAFPVELSVSPNKDIVAGDSIDWTCSFELLEGNVRDVRIKGTGKMHIWRNASDNHPPGMTVTPTLSNDPNVRSKILAVFKASLCDVASYEDTYRCRPINVGYGFSEAEKIVIFAEPSITISINGEKIGENHRMDPDVKDKVQKLKVSISNEMSPVSKLQLEVDGQKFDSFIPNNDRQEFCSYGAELETDYTFTEKKEYTFNYVSETGSGHRLQGSFKVTVKGGATGHATMTQITPTLSTRIPKEGNNDPEGGGLGAGPIVGIVLAVVVVIAGVVLGYICVYKPHKEKGGGFIPVSIFRS